MRKNCVFRWVLLITLCLTPIGMLVFLTGCGAHTRPLGCDHCNMEQLKDSTSYAQFIDTKHR